jgi:glutamate dehydrogenase
MAERATLWLMRHRPLPLDIGAAVGQLAPGMAELRSGLERHLRGRQRDAAFSAEASRLASGIPESLAQQSVLWPLLHTGLDLVDLASRRSRPLDEVAGVYWQLFDSLDLSWLWDAVGALPRSTRWQTQSRSALRDDLMAALADLTDDVLGVGSVADWMHANDRLLASVVAIFTELRRVDAHDITTVSVAVRQLRTLALLA